MYILREPFVVFSLNRDFSFDGRVLSVRIIDETSHARAHLKVRFISDRHARLFLVSASYEEINQLWRYSIC